MEKEDIYILAVESSCDETAASVVRNGREVLSNVIYSQIDLHTLYGGVVPEIASRKHIEKINQVIEKALSDAGITLQQVTAVAVTYGRAWWELFWWEFLRQRPSPSLPANRWWESIISKAISALII